MHDLSDEEIRRNWRHLWLSSIQVFADRETQEARWPKPMGNPHYTWDECMIGYFDDAWMSRKGSYAEKVELGHLSEAEAAAAAEFHNLAESYQLPEEVVPTVQGLLSDPAWQAVVDAARRLQNRLLELLTDEDEIAVLTTPQQWEEHNGVFRATDGSAFYVPAG